VVAKNATPPSRVFFWRNGFGRRRRRRGYIFRFRFRVFFLRQSI